MSRKLIIIHRVLGHLMIYYFALMSLSGIILLFKEDLKGLNISLSLDESAASNQRYLENAFRGQIVNKIEQKARAEFPILRIISLFLSDDEKTIQVRMQKPDVQKFRGAKRLSFDKSGELIKEKDQKSSFMELVLEFHRELMVGSIGKLIQAFLAFLTLIVLISGLYFSFKMKKAYELRKVIDLGLLHQKLGRAVFGWLFLITLTGLILSLNSTLIKLHFQGVMSEQQKSNLTAVDKYADSTFDHQKTHDERAFIIIEKIEKEFPEKVLDFLSYPNTEFSMPGVFVALLKSKQDHELVFFRGLDAKVLSAHPLPLSLKFLLWSEPLHFGDFAGLGLKIIWGLLSLLVLYMLYLAFERRSMRRKKHAIKSGDKLLRVLIFKTPASLIWILPALVLSLFVLEQDLIKFILMIVFFLYVILMQKIFKKT